MNRLTITWIPEIQHYYVTAPTGSWYFTFGKLHPSPEDTNRIKAILDDMKELPND